MTVLKDVEDMTAMALDARQVDELVGDGGTCVFIWSTADGHPVGVTVAYVYRDGVFWTTTAGWRQRVKALRARPKSSIVVIKDRSSVTFKGHTIIHGPGDTNWADMKSWFYAALSGTARNPADPAARAMRQLLDSPGRVILETRAEPLVTFDWQKFGSALGTAVAAGVGSGDTAERKREDRWPST
jgi:hypothetical protein